MTTRARRSLSEEERRRAELQLLAVSVGASCWMIDLSPYETCRVAGVVERLCLDPVEGHMDAVVSDGTGRLVARWAIQRPTPQLVVSPGRFVSLEGVPRPTDDGFLMLEPSFELVKPSRGG